MKMSNRNPYFRGKVFGKYLLNETLKNKEFLNDIIAKIGGAPEAIVLNNILGRSDALHDMAGADAVVLVLQTENSRFTDAQYERVLCEGYGVPVLGTIVVE